MWIKIRQITASLFGVKSELQHLHAGKSRLFQQFPHTGRQKSQVFRDNVHGSQRFSHLLENGDAGALFPGAVHGGILSGRNRVIFVKPPEMVHPHHIIQGKTVLHPTDPPGKAGFGMVVPAVQGVAPQLARSGKRVRRTSGHRRGTALLVKLEQFRVAPAVRAVESHIDRNVSDNPDSLPMGIGLQRLPLSLEHQLLKLIKPYVVRQFFPAGFHGLFLPQFDRFFPLIPADFPERPLHRGIQAVFPGFLAQFRLKQRLRILSLFFQPFFPSLIRLPQHGKPAPVHRLVIDIPAVASAVRLAALRHRQIPFCRQLLQINKIRIAGKG